MHVKSFRDRYRFLAEVRNYAFFRNAGFLVPRRLEIRSTKLQVVYERISGHPANVRHLDAIIELVSQIHRAAIRSAGLVGEREVALAKYLRDVQLACRCFDRDSGSLEHAIGRSFFPTLFRDAKPENWIVSNGGRIFLIDFDYVVTSGPLQDLAQFLTGAWINDPTSDGDAFVFAGLDRLLGQEPWASSFVCSRSERYELFAAAALLSIAKKLDSSRQFDYAERLARLANSLIDYLPGAQTQ